MKCVKELKDKIFLENLIFYRAELTGISLYAIEGRLSSDLQTDCLLEKLLDIYNGLFLAENQCFIMSEKLFFQHMEKSFFIDYYNEKKKNYPLRCLFLSCNKKPA